jgi:PAS domain S-box-containing protein
VIRVLCVDDEPDLADTAAAFLERDGDRLSVRTVESAQEALAVLDGDPIDCIVSDYDIPGTNGIELLERVRTTHADLPFILYTGKGSEAVASDAISAGVTDYLQKGVGTSQYTLLANRIRNAVDNYRAQAKLAEREKRLNLFFEQSPLGVVEWDDRFDLVRLNDAAEEILGYTQEDLAGGSWAQIVPESDRDAVDDVVSGLLEDEGGYYSINENVRKDGDRVVCEWHNRVVTDESGDVVAVFSQFQDITDRRQQKRENNRRRHRLEQILKTVPGCVVQLDRAGQFVFANQRAEEVLGLERDSLTDRTYADPEWDITDLDGDPIPDEELPFRRVRDTGEPLYGFKHTIQWPDGTRKALLVNGAPLYDDDGAVDSVVFSLTDITGRRARERRLSETRRRLKLALNATDTGVWEWNLETDEVSWNETLERVLGFEPGEFPGTLDAFIDRVHPEDVPEVRAKLNDAIETDSMYQAEFRMFEKDGSVQWSEARGQLVHDDGDDRMVGIHRNITERKERERQLATVKSQYQTVVDNFPDGAVFLFDEECRYVRAGGEGLEAVGLSERDFVGSTPNDLFPDDIAAGLLEHYRASLAGASHTFEQEYAGNRYRVQAVPVRSDGDVSYGMAVSKNITERAEQRRELERQNERLNRFARVVSHDLRNPLNVVDGRLELAQQECDSPHLDDAAAALDRSFALIDDVLTLAREGRAVSDPEPVDLEAVCQQCWQNIETAEATLTTDVDRKIRADPARLRQLLENLLGNAIEHAGADVRITVGELDDGFYFQDDGPGIPPDDREAVFEPGHTTADQGTGFGLRIVEEIADAHGWAVRATDGDNGGARFEITGVAHPDE